MNLASFSFKWWIFTLGPRLVFAIQNYSGRLEPILMALDKNVTYSEGKELYLRESESEILSPVSNSTSLDGCRFQDAKIQDEMVAKLYDDTLEPGTVRVEGVGVGRTEMLFHCKLRNGSDREYRIGIAVIRGATNMAITKAFTIVISGLIFINFTIMGFHLQPQVIKAVLKKPFAPIIGFVCQYGMMPLIATLWGSLLLSHSPPLQLGYFVIGCCPGGGATNKWTLLLGGNLDLSVTMTFLSLIAALGMMPFWLFTMGRLFQADDLRIPFGRIAISLALMTLPIFLGMAIKHLKPELEKQTKKLIKVTSLIILCIIIPFGLYANWFVVYLITWKIILCGMLLPYTGLIVAYLVAWILKQDHKERLTIGIEAGIQNVPVAIVLLNTSLQAPDNDLALVIPATTLFLTQIPFFIMLIFNAIRKKIKEKGENYPGGDCSGGSNEIHKLKDLEQTELQ